MTHNKGKSLIHCKECNRRRYCLRVPIPNYNFKWTCSKGHSWIEVGITLNRINAIMQDRIFKNIGNLFERNDTFYQRLK